jgi:AraC family transcriptional regulator
MADDVEIRTMPPTRVAYMRHVGPYGSPGIGEMWRRLESWCTAQGLSGRRMFGIAQDNPHITPPEQNRYDACIEIDPSFHTTGGDIGVQTIRGGRYACVPFTGTPPEIRAAWVTFLGKTLPESGHEPDLSPAIEIYEPGFAIDRKTGAFTCSLCMPVRAG